MYLRWHLYRMAFSILFFCELAWKTITCTLHTGEFWFSNVNTNFISPSKMALSLLQVLYRWQNWEHENFLWEREIVQLKTSAVCFSHHIVWVGLCTTLVPGTSPEIILQAFFSAFQQLCFLNAFTILAALLAQLLLVCKVALTCRAMWNKINKSNFKWYFSKAFKMVE